VRRVNEAGMVEVFRRHLRPGGLLLLLVFYVATGLANQQLQGRLTRRVLIEYGLVTLVGLVVLLGFGP